MDIIHNLYQNPQAPSQVMDACIPTVSGEQVQPKAAQCLLEGPASEKPLEGCPSHRGGNRVRPGETLRQQVKKTLLDGATSGCLLSALANLPSKQRNEVREERTLQQEVKHTLLDGFVSGRLLSALAHLEQPRNMPKPNDSEMSPASSCSTDSESEACSEKIRGMLFDSRARDALTKSERPEVADASLMPSLLDASLYVHAIETSPTKGKMVASPKRGGS